MSLQDTKMAAMKPSFFFFILFVHLRAYHARHLHDGYIYPSFDRRPVTVKMVEAAIIQMVTGEEEEVASTVYGGDKLGAPKGPTPRGQTNYGGYNPKAPLPPKVAPSSEGLTVYGGENLGALFAPKGPTPRGQSTYGGDNPNSNSQTIYGGAGVAKKTPAGILLPTYDETAYYRDNLYAKSPPKGPGSGGQSISGRDKLKAPPLAPPSLQPDSSMDRTTYGRDDPTTPSTPDPNDTVIQGMYGRVDPIVRTPPQPADTTRPMLNELNCHNGGNSCADSKSTVDDGLRNRIPMPEIRISPQDEDQLFSIASNRLLSYIIRIFNK